MRKKLTSMKAIADTLGVSRVTVSNALSGTGRVSAEMAERVRATARAMQYVPSQAGRSLRTGRSTLIALVIPDFARPIFCEFVQAFARAARNSGMGLLVGEAMGNEATQAEVIRDFVARGVDGLIVLPLRGGGSDFSQIPLPVVVVDSAANPSNITSSDHRDGGRQAARLLADLGHRRVQVMLSAQRSFVSDARGAGMAEMFAARGVRTRIDHIVPDFDAARDFAATWQPGDITAVCAAYDAVAVGIIAGLSGRGIRVPQDMSVTGFDDVIWARIVSPPLTTVRQDVHAIAAHALDVVTGQAHAPRLFPVSLVVRDSTAPPRQDRGNIGSPPPGRW